MTLPQPLNARGEGEPVASHCGKQVFVGSEHFADARDPTADARIVEALNHSPHDLTEGAR